MLTSIRVYIEMRKFMTFITAVWVLFLVKLRWPRNRSLSETYVPLRMKTTDDDDDDDDDDDVLNLVPSLPSRGRKREDPGNEVAASYPFGCSIFVPSVMRYFLMY